jgi:F-type H+-transporting ATPase subunit gamma
VKPSGPHFNLQAKRTAVNLKAVQERMKSVSSIRKITKAMKMVSAAKMKGDERRVRQAAAFTSPIAQFFDQFPRPTGAPTNVGVIVVGSDKGLCGGVNGAVAREAKKFFGEMDAQNIKTHVIGVGQKATASLRMMHSHRFTTSFDEVSKIPINFLTASAIAHHVTQQAFDSVALISNSYVSIVSFNTQNQSVLTGPSIDKLEPLSMSQAIDRYSLEPSMGEVSFSGIF